MNLIPESNGFKKVNMKDKLTTFQWGKRIAIIIAIIIGSGFIFQTLSNFIGNEKIKQRLNSVKIEENKLEYKVDGSGDYTIVFDGAIGTNLYSWSEITKKVEKDLGVRTLVYNRVGYGFNTIRESRTIDQQTDDLRALVKKMGLTDKLILVGEEYGSLVMTNFAEKYPELVSGVVLIKPLLEDEVKSEEFKKDIRWTYYKSKVESVGASFGLTTLLDKLGLDYTVDGFEENLPKGADEEFSIHKTKKDYRRAISYELENLYKYTGDSQKENMLGAKPLYIISNDENDPIAKIGSKDLTTTYFTESDKDIISSTDSEAVITGISVVLKESKKIDKLASKNK